MTLNQAIMELVMISEHRLMPTILRERLKGIIDAMSEWDEPEKETDRWIPCSDRLPEVKPEGEIEVMGRSQLEMMDSTFEISEPVEVTCETDVGYKVTVAQWEVDGERRRYWVNDDGVFVDGVIAWRPMPEPYQEVEHE